MRDVARRPGTREVEIDVLLFGGLREAVGLSRVPVALAEGASVTDLLDHLGTQYPPVSVHRPSLAVARNRTLVGRDATLERGDEVALLPPVGGG